jgi:RimJ/RimL family protein N-acetyltransferase
MIGRGGLRNNIFVEKNEVEIAYGLMPEFWNKGLATEFVEAVVRIGFTEIGLSTLVCTTQPDNMASKRVLEKSNFRHERDIIYLDRPHLLYRRDKG